MMASPLMPLIKPWQITDSFKICSLTSFGHQNIYLFLFGNLQQIHCFVAVAIFFNSLPDNVKSANILEITL